MQSPKPKETPSANPRHSAQLNAKLLAKDKSKKEGQNQKRIQSAKTLMQILGNP